MKKPSSLTDKQMAFVRAYVGKMKSFTASAREAGYADPGGEVDRLKSNPEVMTAIAEFQRAEMVSWTGSVLKARKVLDEAMEPLHVAFDERKQTYVFLDAKMSDRIAAASKLLDVAAKFDEESLQAKARKEDQRDRRAIIEAALGEITPEPPPILEENPEKQPPLLPETFT